MTNRLPSEVANYYRGREDQFLRDLKVMAHGQEMMQGREGGAPSSAGPFTIPRLNEMWAAVGRPWREPGEEA